MPIFFLNYELQHCFPTSNGDQFRIVAAPILINAEVFNQVIYTPLYHILNHVLILIFLVAKKLIAWHKLPTSKKYQYSVFMFLQRHLKLL